MSTVKIQVPPWQRCDVSMGEAMAIKAMHANNASPDQQRIFMHWLNTKASPVMSIGWNPDSDRTSTFEAGRRFIGLKIIEVIKNDPEFYNQGETNG